MQLSTIFFYNFEDRLQHVRIRKNQFNLQTYSMAKITKNILSLNHEEVMDFFMNSKQYYGFVLPKHFVFDKVQKHVQEETGYSLHKGGVQETSPYTLRQCQLVSGKTIEPLWNNEYLELIFHTMVQLVERTRRRKLLL